MRLEIIVSLRTAASAEAPLTPMKLPPRLRAMGGMGMVRERVGVSMGADAKAINCGGCQQRARWCKQGVVRARLT